MATVSRIAPELKRVDVPDELKMLEAWLCWRSEQHPGEAKPRKVPYYASGARRFGTQGSIEDRAKLLTFPAALAAAQRLGMDGVGFAPMPEFGITVLDFDKCVGPDGELPPEIEAITTKTYAEYSPSGSGIHAVLRGDTGDMRLPARGGDYGIDTFSRKGFITFTGSALPYTDLLDLDNTVATVTPAVRELLRRRFGEGGQVSTVEGDFMAGLEPRLGFTPEQMERMLGALDPSMGRDEWIRVGLALHHECEGDDTGFWLWDQWSSGGDSYPGEEALRYQWDSFKPMPGRRQVTMASVVKMVREAEGASAPTAKEVMAKADVIQAELPEREKHGRFHPEPISDLAKRPPPRWLIKGALPEGEMNVLFGASGSGKTFVALGMAICIARGDDWFGHRTRQGRVVIIAAEGGAGIGKRGDAYALHHGIDIAGLDVHVITAAPNFLDGDDISEVIAEIKALGNVALVQVDTMAQVSPGANENSSEDMSRVLANLKLMHRAIGATIQVVHHAGKDLTRGSRGWSGIKAAADSQLEILRHESGEREIHVDKMKDGEDGLRFGFKLEVVDLGIDGDGDPLTSCVAVAAELPKPKAEEDKSAKDRFGKWERHILEIAAAEYAGQETAPLATLLELSINGAPPPNEGERDIRRQSINRAMHTLAGRKDGPITIKDGLVIFYTP